MTINDLWHEVDIDHEEVALERARGRARTALTPKLPFLMEASCQSAFEDKMALIEPDIDRIVTEAAGSGAAYALTRTAVVEDLYGMFARTETKRRRVEGAQRARERQATMKKAATQGEVDAWLARQDPLFAEWAKPYAQRMVYGPTYMRSIATNLPDAARAFSQGGFDSKQFRYVRSQLDAALGSECGEDWFWDEGQGEYTQRLDNTIAAKQPEPKMAKFVVRQRGTMSGGQHSFDTRDEAQTKADALNTEHGTNDYIVSEEGDAEPKESAKVAARKLVNVTDDQVRKFQDMADAIGYVVQADEAHDILLMNGGFKSALESAGIWGDRYQEVNAEGGIDVDANAGGISMLIETTDPSSWYHSHDYDEENWANPKEPDPSDYDALKAKLRRPKNKEYCDTYKGYALEHKGSRKQAISYSATAPSYFIADYDKVNKALEDGGWVMTDPEGFQYVSPDAPPELVRLQQQLIQMGYANGHFAVKQAVEIFDRPAGGARADVLWDLAVDNGMTKTWVTTSDIYAYEARVSTTIEGAIANYNGRFFGEFSNVGRAKAAVEEQILKDHPEVFPREAKRMSLLWKSIDGIATTEVGKYALTVVPDSIGVCWAITDHGGEVEYATGKSRTIESAKTAMQKRSDIFGQDPDVVNQNNPPKKKAPKKKVVGDDPDAVDEAEDEEDPDAIEDDAEVEAPLEGVVEDQVETVDPMTLDVGDTLTVSYTMGTGETGEVEGVFVRLEDDIAFFSGPNGEFGVAERDGVWVDSEGNQFTFSFGSPDETGDTDPNQDMAEQNPATPAEEPPVADAEDKGDTEYAVDDDKKPKAKDDDGKKKKSQPPWLKGKGSTMDGTLTLNPTFSAFTGTVPMNTTSVAYMTTPESPIRSMAELVTVIGALAPNLGAEEIFGLAQEAMAANRRNAGR